jgi:hypothetical protein
VIDMIWETIIQHEGEIFKQIKGKEFTYTVKGNTISLNTTNRTVSKSIFEQALQFVPLENTVAINHLQAPSYIYAILMDNRIRQSNW